LKNFIAAWFALDTVLVLFPPIYLFISGMRDTVLGVPIVVAYFLLTGLCIASSIVAAYLVDCEVGEI
jgi:hypothetical protein